VFWCTYHFLLGSGGRLKTAVKRRGDDWKRSGCSRAELQVQSFSIAPWERPEFASVQSKVPFAWHFLDNRSLINHWPWIRIFKGTNGAETTKTRLCVRELYVLWLRTLPAWAVDGHFQSWLIHSSQEMRGRRAHTSGHIPLDLTHNSFREKDFQVGVVIGEDLKQQSARLLIMFALC